MRAPHPAFRELYRQAATLMRFSERERGARTTIQRFEVERDAQALGGETLLAPLLGEAALGSALEAVLGHLSEAQQAEPERMASAPHRLVSAAVPRSASERRRARSVLPDRGFAPESHPRLAALLASAQARNAAVGERLENGAAAARLPQSRAADAVTKAAASAVPVFTAPVAMQRLVDLARRAGAEDALHHPVEIERNAETAKRLAASEVAPPAASGASESRSSDPAQSRLHKIVARIEHAAVVTQAVERKEVRREGQLPGQAERAAPTYASEREPQARARASGGSQESVSSPPPPAPVATSIARPTVPPASLGGFRRLAELGRQAATPQRPADPPPLPAAHPPPAAAAGIDPEQLGELLRREAQRHGIDVAGLEP